MLYDVGKLLKVELGRQGENHARTVEIDVRSMLAQQPSAVFFLLVKRKGDTMPYVAATEVVNGILRWPITSMETAFAGDGKIEVRAVTGDVVAKSATGTIHVRPSLTGSDEELPSEPPIAPQGWVDQIVNAGAQAVDGAAKAEAAANEAAEAAKRAEGVVDDFQENGVAASAKKLETPRIISLSGDMSGSVAFDGSGDVTIEAAVKAIPKEELGGMLQ